ncbi:MAG: glycosyltransferase [Spirosomataceae bacterium]
MKIVFLGSLADLSASSTQRLWALKQCHAEVFAIDRDQYKSPFGRFAGHLARVLQQPRLLYDTAKIERDLLLTCKQISPDIIWIEWPREVSFSTLQQLQKLWPRPFIISFQDDNPWGDRNDTWQWKEYFKNVKYFDLHLVKRPSDIQNIKKLGAKNCRYWHHGIYSPLFYPSKEHTSYQYPVIFIGTCMDNRSNFIEFLLEAGLPIHVFGNGWIKHAFKLVKRFPNNFHPAVVGKSYADTIRSSLVSLIMVSESNHDEWTMRSYEVPGCGIAPLAYDTSTHRQMFSEGTTGFFFKDAQSCLSTITGLIDNPNLCKQVGVAVEQDFQHRNWRIEARMEELLKQL